MQLLLLLFNKREKLEIHNLNKEMTINQFILKIKNHVPQRLSFLGDAPDMVVMLDYPHRLAFYKTLERFRSEIKKRNSSGYSQEQICAGRNQQRGV